MPGVENADEAIQAIGKTAKLYFVLADNSIVVLTAAMLRMHRLRRTVVITKSYSNLTAKVPHCLKKELEKL